AARVGRLSEAQRLFERALQLTENHPEGKWIGKYFDRASYVLRALGRRAAEYSDLQADLEQCARVNIADFPPCLPANIFFESAVGDWFWGDDADFAAKIDELEVLTRRSGLRGFELFLAFARGERWREPNGTERDDVLVWAHLIAASQHFSHSAKHATAAIEAADRWRAPFLRGIARAAGSVILSQDRDRLVAQAREIASTIESPPLHEAIDALARGERHPMLRALLARFDASHARVLPRLEISFLDGVVRREGKTIELSDGDLALLLLVAARRKPSTRETITSALWPEVPASTGRNRLNVRLHDLRSHAGEDVIIFDSRGYRVADGAHVDLWQIAELAAAPGPPPPRSRQLLELVTRGEFDKRVLQMDFLRPALQQARELARDACRRWAIGLLESDRCHEALMLARVLREGDPCDEEACELSVRALAAIGDVAAAEAEYRRYAATLERELEARPSSRFTQYVASLQTLKR
ncbi:MAG: hypothetical protein JO092_08485, partial [Candidatus Eremiobacteraeota bacterium]|nr:hypothetical protein [Candidatus Eremiobacteraeota bacterium]